MASKRVAVVTGSNKGIGFAIVRSLCKKFDGDVILTARNEELGKKAVTDLEGEGLRPLYHQLDITSTESIEKLRGFLENNYKGLDILINNAGVYDRSKPDIEQAVTNVAINFTGTLNVSHGLFPILQPHSRVVNVASQLGHLNKLGSNIQAKFTDPTLTETKLIALVDEYIEAVRAGNATDLGWTNAAYGTSKTALIALSKIHAKELSECGKEDIILNCCCPGWVRTDMTSDQAPLTPDQGAETPVMLALLPAGSPFGEFWYKKKVGQW